MMNIHIPRVLPLSFVKQSNFAPHELLIVADTDAHYGWVSTSGVQVLLMG
jgi:hypothetical protein